MDDDWLATPVEYQRQQPVVGSWFFIDCSICRLLVRKMHVLAASNDVTLPINNRVLNRNWNRSFVIVAYALGFEP